MGLAGLPLILKWAVLGVWALSLLVGGLLGLLALTRLWRAVSHAYLLRRRAFFFPAIEALVMEEDGGLAERLRPGRWGDAAIVEEMLVELFAMVEGPLRERVSRLGEEIGLVHRHLKRLVSPRSHARAEAMERLGLLRSRRAVPSLLAALESEAPGLRVVAARALGRIQDPTALPGLLKALSGLPGSLGNPVAQALGSFGEKAVPSLLAEMESRETLRARVAMILGEVRSLSALPALAALLAQDRDPQVRAACAAALGQIAHPDAVPPLLEGLRDPFREVRAQSAWALGRMDDPSACPRLEEALLKDSYWWVRVRAAEALARLAEGRALLERHKEAPDPILRSLAREMLFLAGRGP